MAVSLKKYLNNKLKQKGITVKEAKKNAGKYKSISAAKKKLDHFTILIKMVR